MLKACVIGMGPIGNLHADVLAGEALAELAAVCDIIPERARSAGERLGVPWFTDALEMLRHVRPDLCHITTGGYEYGSDHWQPTLQAFEAGCHVLCEKPISNDIPRAIEMVQAGRRAGRCFGINFNHRFTEAARVARQWVDEGKIGPQLFVNVALWIGRFQDPDSPYFHIKALTPHAMDLIRHFCGDVESVQCFAMKAPGRRIWSTASFNFRLASGAVGHLTSSYDIGRGHPMERCEVAGTEGRFVLEDMWREATLYPASTLVKTVYTNPVFGGFRDFNDTFRDRIHRFLEQVDSGAGPDEIDSSGADGLEAQRIIEAAILSLEQGRIVRIEEIAK